ncbi:hypothetical protein [Streptomyces sp. MBT33]|uniref:hypothetical protein n=1 Tax=Streptomyces sp. MBT33 TaxID=1488363 RepID=UPI001909C9B1|nr:hypothetical protein [Streptomyces sp. MBT33]MBK3645934.1 hypothetical protein [Streptomyces sp. MBT33]
MSAVLDQEIQRVNSATRAMIDAYCQWNGKIETGEIEYSLYGDLLEFVNFRIETADSCLLLLEHNKVADSLGLCRPLLENYLIFMLMCRGHKFFQLQDLSGEALTEGQFKARVKEAQEELEKLKDAGTAQYIDVKRYPRAKHRIMYVFEGLKDKDDPTHIVPLHFFQFQDFNPELMRLKEDKYFQYYEHSKETKKVIQGHVEAEAWRYKYYLAYDALLHNLEINDIIDAGGIARIEAHYTFLGKFVHPTKDAARDLHERSNWHSRHTGIGIAQPYEGQAKLLAALYLCHLVAGLLNEIAALIEKAPSKYITDAGTEDVRRATACASDDFGYFWFLFNKPPRYDRFNYCVHHATQDQVNGWGGYENVPIELVSFNKDIYGNFKNALNSQRTVLYTYQSPLPGM